jgi:hypothetical protein
MLQMNPMKWITVVLGVLGLVALVVAIIYFTVPAHSLPSFLGPLHRVAAKRKRRGEAAIGLAVVLFVVAGIVVAVGRRSTAAPTPSSPATPATPTES